MVDYMEIIDLPLDIINIIVNMLTIKYKIYFMAINIFFSQNVCIFSMGMFSIFGISQNVIEQEKFKNLKSLTLCNATNDINKSLNISRLTKLSHLKLFNDYPIKGVSYLTNLTELCASSYNKDFITQNDIMNLSLLTSLDISFNKNISNINHLTNLLFLEISGGHTQIHQSSIINLTNLTYLNIETNTQITNLSHLPNLSHLKCYGTNIDITKLYKLHTLELFSKMANIDISHLTNLFQLYASKSFITRNKIIINNLSNLIHLNENKFVCIG